MSAEMPPQLNGIWSFTQGTAGLPPTVSADGFIAELLGLLNFLVSSIRSNLP
ncbi:MAG: hypothetical protein ACYDA2_00825 [Acidimicrobiales bacterium]